MKRLLIFTENYARGGGNRYMIDLLNALAPDFEQVLLVSNEGGIFPEDTSRINDSVVQREVELITRPSIDKKLSALPRSVRKIIALLLFVFEPILFIINTIKFIILLKKIEPSLIVSCNGGFPAAQACLSMVVAGRISRVSVVLSVVSMPLARRLITWLYEWMLDKLIWASASLVIVNAKSIASAMIGLRSAPVKKIRVIHNGLEDIQLLDGPITEQRHDFLIGCIARMDRAKGIMVLFDAFVQLAERHPTMRLVLAGHGDVSEELARRIEFLGLQSKVDILGHFDGNIEILLSSFNVYVFPSLWEGFPYSIIEALRSACVIVATKVGGIPEAVTDGVEGILITPGSVDEIIQAVEKIFANRTTGKFLAKNARIKFEKNFTLSMMHRSVHDVYVELKQVDALWR